MSIFNNREDFERFEKKIKPILGLGLICASYILAFRAGTFCERDKSYQASDNPMTRSAEIRSFDDVLSRRLENMYTTKQLLEGKID